MSFLSKKEVLASIKTRTQNLNGTPYTIHEAYLGVNPLTKKPVRKYARSLPKLKAIIQDFFNTVDHCGVEATTLTPQQSLDAKQALNLLSEAKISMTLKQCVEMLIDGKVIDDNASSFCTPIGEAYDKYLVSVKDKSADYQKNIRGRVGVLVTTIGRDRIISKITAAEIKTHLMDRYYRQGDVGSWVTYNNALGNIKTFFGWCADEEQGLCKKSPAESMKKLVLPYRQPAYMKAIDVKKIFNVLWEQKDNPARATDLAYAILSFFCGMRSSEIARTQYNDGTIKINLEEMFIRIELPKGASKGIRPRTFIIPDQALAWMKSFDFKAAVVRRNAKYRRHLILAAKTADVTLPKNPGRHTFITMFEAVHHDINALTAIAGNTDDVRAKSYNGVELAPEGRAYFNILPPQT